MADEEIKIPVVSPRKSIQELEKSIIFNADIKMNEEGKSVKALIDTGANKSLIQSKYVPVDAILERSSITFQTGSGKLKSEQKMVMKYQLPQFTSHRVAESEFHLIESLSYPIILGTDFLLQFGFNLNLRMLILDVFDEIKTGTIVTELEKPTKIDVLFLFLKGSS